ncbi:hypothetical protein [Ruegeria conchae]|uniref:Uncharacterized protein n=1 Tax=Ruegeria conchae TaxID=981384 RepID=A0A497ZN35_9RHOB|nr:hypothetical protein [Ruegeria conchae]RLK10809.1 hypothetical protein CLV75_0795 [Ruegeria conchae]UWR01354.1 hypothetical protein K3740_09640 [Ruegeria conchae]
MESELPILLYLFYSALAALALVHACHTFRLQQPNQIRSSSRSDLNTSQIKS